MIDIHCHILPGIDDGPQDIKESIEMARIAAADGISVIVATPHLNSRVNISEDITSKVIQLNARLRELKIPVRILRGADVSVLASVPSLKDYTINNSKYILFEFPYTHIPVNAGRIIFNAMSVGLHPIITHPERNPSAIRNPSLIISLRETGSLVQITAASLTGRFGDEARECAIYLLKKKVVDIIATDAHSSGDRKPVLSEGLAVASSILGAEAALRLVQENPLAVIEGRPLDS